MDANTSRYLSVPDTAAQLGVPAGWLREEIDAGRLPHLRAGRSMRCNPEAVAQALDERARETVRQPVDIPGGVLKGVMS